MNNFFCNFEAIDLISFVNVHISLEDENYLTEKKFARILYDFFEKNADVSKNLKTRFLINVKSYKAEIWSTCSLGNYLYFVTSIFGQKSNFSIFRKKWRHKNGQKMSKNYFFKKAYDKVEISTQGTLTPNFSLIGIDPIEKSCL